MIHLLYFILLLYCLTTAIVRKEIIENKHISTDILLMYYPIIPFVMNIVKKENHE